MRVLRLNIGNEQEIQVGEKTEITGLFKHHHFDSILVGKLGAKGDFIGSEKHHGGTDQAIYMYTQPDYFAFQDEYGIQPVCGLFGENINVSILESREVVIGDIFEFPNCSLQVTGPRFPCATLAASMKDPMFVKKFVHVARPGLYFRVLREGSINRGDTFERIPYDGTRVTNAEIFADHYEKSVDKATLEKYLTTPLAIRIRVSLEKRLAEL